MIKYLKYHKNGKIWIYNNTNTFIIYIFLILLIKNNDNTMLILSNT